MFFHLLMQIKVRESWDFWHFATSPLTHSVRGDIAFFLSHSFVYVWSEISSIHKLGKLRNRLEKFQKNLLPEVFI